MKSQKDLLYNGSNSQVNILMQKNGVATDTNTNILNTQTASAILSGQGVITQNQNQYQQSNQAQNQLTAVQLREKYEKVLQVNKRQDINTEIYLPNIKPLKPPGFSLQQKTQKNKERIVKAAIQSSLQAQTKEYYSAQRNSSNGNQRSDYECVFQHIQTRQLIGSNEELSIKKSGTQKNSQKDLFAALSQQP
eukprot:403355536